MRKLLSLFLTGLLFVAGCQTEQITELIDDANVRIIHRECATNEVLQADLLRDPSLGKKMNDIELFTEDAIRTNKIGRLVNGQIVIPVVVHVIYRTAAENISDAQVASQIDILNEDFTNTNADRNIVPTEFQDEQTSVGVKFVLDRIIRKYSSKKSWPYNHSMKSSKTGGSDPVDPSQYLNVWLVNKIAYQGSYLFGFATFPGGDPAVDGVVIGSNFWGRVGNVQPPYDRGRTGTHEIGHWMNLRHIWGDATCGDDLVSDTPVHDGPNWYCPAYPHVTTCSGGHNEMTFNYMDYTDDPCMVMFTNGQKQRMLAVFAAGGPRAKFAQ
jgi:hypothetical protein